MSNISRLFKYEDTGLAQNPVWEKAAYACHDWVMSFMGQRFGAKGVESFMHSQPVAAAKRIVDHCDDVSDESITLALLGPVKHQVMQGFNKRENIDAAVAEYGQRAVRLMIATMSPAHAADEKMYRDVVRLFMNESLSAMGDQLIGRKRWDEHHDVRWNMLEGYEKNFAQVKGLEPKLDVLFEDALKQSREALEKIGPKGMPDPRHHGLKPPGFKPPGHG
jgi:hypothetical protein